MVLDGSGKAKDRDSKGAGLSLQPSGSQTSSAAQITSAFEDGKQYDGAVAKKMMEDALSADGREQKDRADKAETALKSLTTLHEGTITQVNTLSSQVADLVKISEEAEVAKVAEDPVALGSLRARQANSRETSRLERLEADIKAREVKLGERDTTLTQREASVGIKLAAMAAGVDEKQLATFVPDGNAERMAQAITIIKQGTGGVTPPANANVPQGLKTTPASVISAGEDSRSVSEKMLEKAKAK